MDAKYAVMAGQVTPGKLFKGLHPDFKAIRMLAGLDRKNAETIFGAIGEEIEKAEKIQEQKCDKRNENSVKGV